MPETRNICTPRFTSWNFLKKLAGIRRLSLVAKGCSMVRPIVVSNSTPVMTQSAMVEPDLQGYVSPLNEMAIVKQMDPPMNTTDATQSTRRSLCKIVLLACKHISGRRKMYEGANTTPMTRLM